METRFFGIRSMLLIGTFLLIGGCSNVSRGDSRFVSASRCIGTYCSGAESNDHFTSLNPQTRTANEYASHCDEQTRERQHELANCTAVPVIVMRLEPDR